MSAGAPLRFEVLGEVRAIRDGQEIDLGPAKQRAVLAVLLLEAGRAVSVPRIVDAVWGDEPPENGANVVQKYVAGLRRVLDPERSPRTAGELLTLSGGGYLLKVEPGALDAAVFGDAMARAAAERDAGRALDAARTLRQALGLWRGQALAGLTGSVFDAARIRLTEEQATAWETWAEIGLELGNHAVMVPDLVRLVADFPLREGLRAHLMVALHRCGRQPEALAVFRDARRYLLDEFGVEPGERLQETHRRILQGDPSLAGPKPDVQAYQPPISGAPPSVPDDPPVVDPPPPPRQPPDGRRYPIVEMVFAGLIPIVVCSVGSWIYFVYAGLKRHDRRQFLVAAVYALLFVTFFLVAAAIDPTPVDSRELSTAENIGVFSMLGLAVTASAHGVILAAHSGAARKRRALRDYARQVTFHDPARARELGIGRPDLARTFDDGGLVDVNHVPGHELARLPGLDSQQAHRIVIERHEHGAFARPEDLVIRGLMTPETLHRLGPRLICVPPGAAAPAPQATADRPR